MRAGNASSYLSTCRAENTGDSVVLFLTLRSCSSKPLKLGYLISAQRDLTGESQENIRKPIIAILTLNSGT